ncbi:MAG: hypothetical protein Q9182_004875 [Xanthomendoza sp. 2 TL-2023]
MLNGIIETEETPGNRWTKDEKRVSSVRFVNGVQEELFSETFSHGTTKRFALNEDQAKETVAITCLGLITAPSYPKAEAKWTNTADRQPLAHFAALFWIDFVIPNNPSPTLMNAIRRLFFANLQIFNLRTELLIQAGAAYLNSKHSDLIRAISQYSDQKSGDYAPPIVWAAAFNLSFIVKELVDQGYPINAAAKEGRVSALYMAVHQKHYGMASLLLSAGGDVADGYTEPTGRYESISAASPLYLMSCRKGYSQQWIDLLLRDRTKFGRPGWKLEVAMESAARFGNLEHLKALVEAGAELNRATGYAEGYGCPLQAACDHGSDEAVLFLLDKDADPDTTGGNIWLAHVHTPLHMASYRGKVGIVSLLLQHGADPNIRGGVLGTALISSIWNAHRGSANDGNLGVMELLLQNGASVEEEWGMTSKLQELNFSYSESKKTSLSERFGKHLARWINSEAYDEDDTDVRNEAALRERIKKKWECIHEGRRRKEFAYMCGCMNQKAQCLHPKVYI